MPKAPIYQRRVELRPLEGGRINYSPTPEAFGAGIGQAIEKVGQRLYQDEVLRQDQIAVMEAERKLSDWEMQMLYDPQKGALTSTKGKETLALPDVLSKNFGDYVTTLRANLTTDRQRSAFDRAAMARFKDIQTTVSRHVYTELQKFDDEETKNFIKNSRDAAVANYTDTSRIATEIERQEAAVTDYAVRRGFGAEFIKQQRAQVRSDTHVSVIERMVANDQDMLAAKYLEIVKPAITDAAGLAKVERWVADSSVRGESQRAADRILADATSRTDALNKARAITDPKIRDGAEERVQRYWSIKEQADNEEREKIMTFIAGGLDRGGKLSQVLPSLWDRLSAPERAAMRAYEKALEGGAKPKTDMGTYYELVSLASSPATAEAFARLNLMSVRHKLDDEDFKHIVSIQAAVRKGDTKESDKLLADDRTQNEIMTDAEDQLDPARLRNKDKDVREKLLAFRRSVRKAISDHQQRTQKPITNDELQTLVDRMVIKGVTEEGVFFDTKKHVFELKPGESLTIKIEDVPDDERAKIEEALRKWGRAVTDEAITTLYTQRLMELRARQQPAVTPAPAVHPGQIKQPKPKPQTKVTPPSSPSPSQPAKNKEGFTDERGAVVEQIPGQDDAALKKREKLFKEYESVSIEIQENVRLRNVTGDEKKQDELDAQRKILEKKAERLKSDLDKFYKK